MDGTVSQTINALSGKELFAAYLPLIVVIVVQIFQYIQTRRIEAQNRRRDAASQRVEEKVDETYIAVNSASRIPLVTIETLFEELTRLHPANPAYQKGLEAAKVNIQDHDKKAASIEAIRKAKDGAKDRAKDREV